MATCGLLPNIFRNVRAAMLTLPRRFALHETATLTEMSLSIVRTALQLALLFAWLVAWIVTLGGGRQSWGRRIKPGARYYPWSRITARNAVDAPTHRCVRRTRYRSRELLCVAKQDA